MIDTLINIIALLVTLGILVTFHEWGHFYAARKLGVRVLRFSVGFGKPIWKKIGKDGVEYVVANIPLGGYVKMLDERDGDVFESDKKYAFNRQPVWKRNIIVGAGPLANFVLAIILFAIMYMIGVQSLKPELDTLNPNSIAAKAGLDKGDQIVAVDGKNVADWQDVNFALAKRIGDGEPIEFVIKRNNRVSEQVVMVPTYDWKVDKYQPELVASLGLTPFGQSTVVGEISKDSAAEKAGLRSGDHIIGLGGQPINAWSEITGVMTDYKGGQISLAYIRNGETTETLITPQKANDRFLIGISLSTFDREYARDNLLITKKYSFFDSIPAAFDKTIDATTVTFVMLKKLIIKEIPTESLGSLPSIAKGAGSSARSGLVYFLGFLGMISVNLGLINLLPIPLLDGGHLLFNTIESIKGSPVSERIQEIGTKLGLVLVLGFMFLALFYDVVRMAN